MRHRRWCLPPEHPVIRAGQRVRDASLERDRAEEALYRLRATGDAGEYRDGVRRLTLAMADTHTAFDEWADAIAILPIQGGSSGDQQHSSQGR